MLYLLCLVGHFGKDIKNLYQVLQIVVVLGGAEAHVVKEVFLVIECHIDPKLLENSIKGCMRDQLCLPVLELAFALEAEAIEGLWLNTVAFEKL